MIDGVLRSALIILSEIYFGLYYKLVYVCSIKLTSHGRKSNFPR